MISPARLLAAALLLAAPADVTALRAQANAAYKAKSYTTACELFAKIKDQTPDDGAAWSDLGLCLGKAGRRDEAIKADRQAVELGDAKTRLGAYYNLAALKATLAVPDTAFSKDQDPKSKTRCVSLGTSGDCTQETIACSHFVDQSGQASTFVTASLVFGDDRKMLEAALQKPAAPQASVVLTTGTFDAEYCRPQDLCGAEPCEDEAAGEAHDKCHAKWKSKCDAAVSGCSTDAKIVDHQCVVVFADDCRGHVGVVCGGKAQELVIPASP